MHGMNKTSYFCPRCFADDEGGSWGEGVVGNGALCANCGAMGAIAIPAWAVASIREQASWVGKRYYPHAEDREHSREVRYLRSIAPPAAGVTAEHMEGAKWNHWCVTSGTTSIMPIVAASEEAAIREGRLSLPYPVPTEFES